MAKLPITLSTPAPRNVGEPVQQKPQVAGAAKQRAADADVTLSEAGAEVMTADGEVGGVQEEPKDPGGRPVYKPAIPWPAAQNGRKPYKI
jgi:hypothetical protein